MTQVNQATTFPLAAARAADHSAMGPLAQQALAECACHGTAVVDAHGRLLWQNAAFARLGAEPAAAGDGAPLVDSLRSAGFDAADVDRVATALANGEPLRMHASARAGTQRTPRSFALALTSSSVRTKGTANSARCFVLELVDQTELVTDRQRHDALLAAIPAGVVLFSDQGAVIDCNATAEQQFDLNRAQLNGMQAAPDADFQVLRHDMQPMRREDWPAVQALRSGTGVRGISLGIQKNSQSQLRWLQVNAEPVRDEANRITGAVACCVDVTEQRKQDAVLAHTVEAAGLGTWILDLAGGHLEFNDRVLTMLGWRPGDFGQERATWIELVHPEDRSRWQQALHRHLADPSAPCRVDLRLRRPDGDWACVQSCGVVVARDSEGRALRMAGINIDMTEQVQMQAMLRHAARTDGLTQLPNRTAVFDRVQEMIERAAQRSDYHYAVLYMDFDRFKQVNDTLGHAAGDELLRQIAQRLRRALRAGDAIGLLHGDAAEQSAGRIGGDEFVVVLDDIKDSDGACRVAKRLLDVFAAPYRLGDHTVQSTASIGIVTSEHAATDAATVMRDADTAMYEAKRSGRGRWVLFQPAMHERVAHGAAIESELRSALAKRELYVVYQPVVGLHGHGGRHDGVEALVRWRHPTRGLVPPLQFIGVAEESGLIVELGKQVLSMACAQFTAWQRALGEHAPRSLAVNLSPAQLRWPGLLDMVREILADSAIDPRLLQLEVTESLAAQDDAIRARLRELKALGIRIALDDFGTGYSSLACLHQLPVDTVKIDRSFVIHAEVSAYHRVLIEATIRVAQTLGMGTVAEGIETESQRALLQSLQCDRGQGYLWSRPLEADALADWLLGAPATAPAPLARAA